MSVSWGDCEEIIKKYEPTSAGQRDKWLGIDGMEDCYSSDCSAIQLPFVSVVDCLFP